MFVIVVQGYRLNVCGIRPQCVRLLAGVALREAKQQLTIDLDAFAMVAIDEAVCRAAAQIGEQLVVQSSQAIHLASAQRLVVPGLPFITFDLRLAQAARSLGFTVLGN
jgi:predicted nucleic acid-binding protein